MYEDQAALEQLKWAVQALAAPAAEQPQLFPKDVCVPCELLTDFQDWYLVTRQRTSLRMTPQQQHALSEIREAIQALGEVACFSAEELSTPSWTALREQAVGCLNQFGWSQMLPPEGRSAYVPAG